MALARQLPARQDDERQAQNDEENASQDDDKCIQPVGARDRRSELQANASKKRATKDHLENLPPTLVCYIYRQIASNALRRLCGSLASARRALTRPQGARADDLTGVGGAIHAPAPRFRGARLYVMAVI